MCKDQDLSVIGAGAKRIWDQAAKRFKGQDAQRVVHIYLVMLYPLLRLDDGCGPNAKRAMKYQWKNT